jgi:hypothetical protein
MARQHPSTVSEAVSILEFHARNDAGLLSRLRPYQGIRDSDLAELRASLETLVAAAETEDIAMRILDLTYTIIWTARAWGVDDAGMLRRNALIENERHAALASWVNEMEQGFLHLLGRLADKHPTQD